MLEQRASPAARVTGTGRGPRVTADAAATIRWSRPDAARVAPAHYARADVQRPETQVTIDPRGAARLLPDLRELWRFHGLAFTFAWRDVKVRYKQSLIGDPLGGRCSRS